ncbi:MAG: leucine-rich repeat protein, partial [Oscillospiraceae bacterium]|nr:leucine-rich repeat protein [Oscillospiraceae bacterium]
MKKKMQRLLSLLLCAVLCFAQLPAAAAQSLYADAAAKIPAAQTVAAENTAAEEFSEQDVPVNEDLAAADAIDKAPTEEMPAAESAPQRKLIASVEGSTPRTYEQLEPVSTFAMTQPALKEGEYIRWFDRVDGGELYAPFYEWLEQQSAFTAESALVQPLQDTWDVGQGDYAVKFTIEGNISQNCGAGLTYDELYAAAEAAYEEEVAANTAAYREQLYAALTAFDRDHPEVFWLSGPYYTGESTWRDICVYEDGSFEVPYTMDVFFYLHIEDYDYDIRCPEYPTAEVILQTAAQVDTAVQTILGGDFPADGTDVEKVGYLNDWLVLNNAYNDDLSVAPESAWECTSALLGNYGSTGPVCEAYSRAFKVLCDEIGIPCVLEEGLGRSSTYDSGGLHMWNNVQIGSEWFAVDVTWNDPYVSNATGPVSGYEGRDWFLLGSDTDVGSLLYKESHVVDNNNGLTSFSFNNSPALEKLGYFETRKEGTFNGYPAQLSLDGHLLLNSINFPDPAILAFFAARDFEENGWLTQEQVAAITEFSLNSKPVENWKGVEYLSGLKKISLIACGLKSLNDLHLEAHPGLESLLLPSNELTEAELSGLTALKTLDVSKNQLTSLDVSALSALKHLSCGDDVLEELILGSHPALTYLDCGNNKLEALELSGAPALQQLIADYNKLTRLDAGGLEALTVLSCNQCDLTELKLSGASALAELYCAGNELTVLDLSGKSSLKHLNCSLNAITTLDLSAVAPGPVGYADRQSVGELKFESIGSSFACSLVKLLGDVDFSRVSDFTVTMKDGTTQTLSVDANGRVNIPDPFELPVSASYTWDTGCAGLPLTASADVIAVHYCVFNNEDLVVTTEPTCTETGAGYILCAKGCGKKSNRILSAIGHDFTMGECTRCDAEDEILDSGVTGENSTINWVLWKGSGEMVFTGTGRLPDTRQSYGRPGSGLWAYVDSKAVKKIIIGDGITYIGDYFFECFEYPREVVLGKDVTAIGDYAFTEMHYLEKVTLPKGLKTIGEGAFYWTGLKEISIPDTVESIGDSAFNDCRGLKELTIPASVKSIGASAFWRCFQIETITILSENLTIGDAAFAWCEGVRHITVPEGVTEIPFSCFECCTNLQTVSLPQSLTAIDTYAFRDTGLTEITIPAGVTNIKSEAFWGCGALKTIRFEGDAPTVDGQYNAPVTPFRDVTATAWYPAGNATWTAEARGILDGNGDSWVNCNITWEPYTDTSVPTGEISKKTWSVSVESVIYLNYYMNIEGFEGVDLAKAGGVVVWTGEG